MKSNFLNKVQSGQEDIKSLQNARRMSLWGFGQKYGPFTCTLLLGYESNNGFLQKLHIWEKNFLSKNLWTNQNA